MEKKNNISIVTVIVIILAIVGVIYLVQRNKPKVETQQPLSQSDIEINNAITSDDTKSINDNINAINVDDTTDADLIPVDKELQNL